MQRTSLYGGQQPSWPIPVVSSHFLLAIPVCRVDESSALLSSLKDLQRRERRPYLDVPQITRSGA